MHDLNDQTLSAYFDGELPEPGASRVRDAVASDSRYSDMIAHMERLRGLLQHRELPDIAELRQGSLHGIERRLSVRSHLGFWQRWRQIEIPLPAAAAAVVAVLALASLLIWAIVPGRAAAPDIMAQGKDVDVTIRVDDAEIEQVLQWLVDKEMLGEVSIQLPEQQWSIVGDPVLLKPTDYPEGFTE